MYITCVRNATGRGKNTRCGLRVIKWALYVPSDLNWLYLSCTADVLIVCFCKFVHDIEIMEVLF